MTRAVPSDALLHRALAAYERLARAIEGTGDPELGLAIAHASGRRALAARASAEPWLVPPTVVAKVDTLTALLEMAHPDDAAAWVDAYPNRILGLLERRAPGLARSAAPRRRWIDRVVDRQPAPRPVPLTVPLPH